ncbi:hypothetical protein CVT25_008757 [Psilocybe cyanescens]|uniref:Uncharacterized protein n=1 Tax=Psilocybe cyanescens TaxID=93625 RepID=A0A409XNV6_PSICY|nr:hypothetical protein CVT25_008757 [Psilocybe cyanescens]
MIPRTRTEESINHLPTAGEGRMGSAEGGSVTVVGCTRWSGLFQWRKRTDGVFNANPIPGRLPRAPKVLDSALKRIKLLDTPNNMVQEAQGRTANDDRVWKPG